MPPLPRTVPPKSTPSGVRTSVMLRTAAALFLMGPHTQCRIKLSAAESNGPSTGRGFITSASTVAGAIDASLRDACLYVRAQVEEGDLGTRGRLALWMKYRCR